MEMKKTMIWAGGAAALALAGVAIAQTNGPVGGAGSNATLQQNGTKTTSSMNNSASTTGTGATSQNATTAGTTAAGTTNTGATSTGARQTSTPGANSAGAYRSDTAGTAQGSSGDYARAGERG
jgi:hypothetical protein